MSNVVIHPSTLEGIKRLAKSIKHEQNIPHTMSLDEAAKAAGFQNLRHAQNTLPSAASRQTSSPNRPLYLTAYWRTQDGAGGRETLLINLRKPWAQLLKLQELKRTRALQHFRIDAPDHFEVAEDVRSQEAARNVICEAARTLQFMEVTGLRPATARTRNFTHAVHGLPDRDHSMVWVDPDTQQFVMTDEPYKDSSDFLARREGWAGTNGMTISTTTWPGIYVPGASSLYLISEAQSGMRMRPLVERLDALPYPLVAEQWQGESAPYAPVFVTPGRLATGRVKRSRPRPPYVGEERNGAVAYGGFLVGRRWRPDGKMPLSSHKQAGQLLKALMESAQVPYKAKNRVDNVRSDLDEWVQREYTTSELPSDEFHSLYYGTASATKTKPKVMIGRVSKLLLRSYPDCRPLRDLLRQLEFVLATV